MKKFVFCQKENEAILTVEFDEMLNFDCKCQIISNDIFNVPCE